jgi:SAM-dependent methyltransferase
MSVASQANDEQGALWNGPAGHAWVQAQDVLDSMFRPFERLLVDAVATASASRVLDVGCGTGSTTLAIARQLGPQGRCVGVDISAPMIAAAQERADLKDTPARFICADAQVHGFDAAGFDLLVSRFGVMFFDDPVRAFANLRRAATPDAGLRFIAWRSADENGFMTTAERAAAPLLPELPARRPGAPGQFAFADASRVQTILEASGWGDVDIRPIDVECVLPQAELRRYITWLGPVGLALRKADVATRERVVEAVLPAFERYVRGTELRFMAACWTIGASAA